MPWWHVQASLEVAARTHDVAKLQHALDERDDELVKLRDCAQHAAALEQHVQALASKLQDVEAANEMQAQTLARKTQQLERMVSELEALTGRYERVECALETAVEFTEQQNVKREQVCARADPVMQQHRVECRLQVDNATQMCQLTDLFACLQLLARLEDATERESKQNESLHALATREAALAEHVRSLVRQCVGLVQQQQERRSAGDEEDDDHDDMDNDGSRFARVQLLLYEAQRGDVMRMLQLLPTVLDDVVATQTAVRKNSNSRANNVEDKRSVSKRMSLSTTIAAVPATKEAPARVRASPVVKSHTPHTVDPDAACFQEQLELIHEAFGAFRAAEVG